MTALPVSVRSRLVASREVQTEASFVPSCIDLKYRYEPQASDQFSRLIQMRQQIQFCMQEIAGNVYDVVSFKDIMFKIEEEFPTSLPVTDLLLITSKLFRQTAEMGRLLGCFFHVVFGDEHQDEHFHFSEIRILQRELREVKQKLQDSEAERDRLQKMLDEVGKVAVEHGKAVELLENHNQALQTQTSALEDQMALLFHQLNSDLEASCKEAFDKVTMEMEMQERLNPTRTTFRQTMDSLSQQIRTARALITEVREALISCSQGNRTGEAYLSIEPSIRFKLKMIDSNFQQLVGRFTAVKDTVVETAHELMTALHERKKILYLSFQHIRLYDLQNAKLRQSKAILTELRNFTNDFLKKMLSTFPAGAITSIDRIGHITTQRWQGGYTLAAMRQNRQGGSTNHGLSDAERMAAESEMEALSRNISHGETHDSSFYGAQGSASGGRSRYTAGEGAILPPATVFDDSASTASPFDTVHELLNVVRDIDRNTDKLNNTLALEDEMSAFLRTLTLSVSSTARADMPEGTLKMSGSAGTASVEKLEDDFEKSLMPTGGQTSYKQRNAMDLMLDKERDANAAQADNAGDPSRRDSSGGASNDVLHPGNRGLSRSEQAQADAVLARQAQQLQRQHEQIFKMQDDFASKLGFLRQVYEARIADLEVKEAGVKQKFNTTGEGGRFGSEHKARKKAGIVGKEYSIVRDVNASRGEDEELQKLRAKSDRDGLLGARTDWKKTKQALQSTRKLREATISEIDRLEQKTEEKRNMKEGKQVS